MTDQEWRERFAFILRKKMRNRNMTQYELAEIIGVDKSAITHYIKAMRMPNGHILSKIAIALNCTIDELARFE